jgi:hypothetical protein
LYWPVVVSVFLCVCSGLHVVAYAIARNKPQVAAGAGGPEAVTGQAVALAGQESWASDE